MNCSDRCTGGSPLAGMRYDCSCENQAKPCTSCAPACDAGCGPSCDPRANAGSGGRCFASNPGPACNGCGDLYWNEWFNHPPQLCQPCDCQGNYTGPGADSIYVTSYRRRDFDPQNPTAIWSEEPQESVARAGTGATRK